MMLRNRDNEAGTSLLEVLVALAIMAFLAVILSYGLGTSTRFLGRSNEVSKQTELAVNRKYLREWIETASFAAFPGRAFVGLSGDDQRMIIEVLPLDGLFWAGEPLIATISAAEDGSMMVQASGKANRNDSLVIDLQLSPQDAGLKIAYFGRVSVDTYPEWHSTWKADFGLPELIKITAKNPSIPFPPMVVRPSKTYLQREMSLSSALPPIRPSRP